MHPVDKSESEVLAPPKAHSAVQSLEPEGLIERLEAGVAAEIDHVEVAEPREARLRCPCR